MLDFLKKLIGIYERPNVVAWQKKGDRYLLEFTDGTKRIGGSEMSCYWQEFPSFRYVSPSESFWLDSVCVALQHRINHGYTEGMPIESDLRIGAGETDKGEEFLHRLEQNIVESEEHQRLLEESRPD